MFLTFPLAEMPQSRLTLARPPRLAVRGISRDVSPLPQAGSAAGFGKASSACKGLRTTAFNPGRKGA